ncbi:MAG: hypothetical protein B7Z40_06690, partial [Bosea sp. 12-68-7]
MSQAALSSLPSRLAASMPGYQLNFLTMPSAWTCGEVASAMMWSDTITLMILGQDFYATFIPHKTIADSSKVNEVLLCLSFDSRADVDAITQKAGAAGGKADVRPLQDMGFMYGRSFE